MAANKFSRRRAARSSRSRKSRRSRGPQTSLVAVVDSISTICATVDVAASALAKDENETLAVNAGQVLLEHVYEPLEHQRKLIEAHCKYNARHSARSQHGAKR
jgi:hypothetical protein